MTTKTLATLTPLLAACTAGPAGDSGDSGPAGLAVLGAGTHDIANVQLSTVATSGDGLVVPRDLEFNPVSGALWVVNRHDDSITIFEDPGTDDQTAETWGDNSESNHFLAQPAALAFTDSDTLATAQEEDEKTQGNLTPADFMGPTLWTGDEGTFRGNHMSHLDMLHNSPNGVGIAWERDNRFWYFDGYHDAITLYDFNEDHDLGGTDHTDGLIRRYVEDELAYVEGVPSHLAFDRESDWLYIADTGNNRIAVLDTTTGEVGGRISPNYDGAVQNHVEEAQIWTLIEGADFGLERPSGLELVDGLLWITDNATGTIYAFDLDGNLVDYLETELGEGCLMGLAFGDDDHLWLVDAAAEQVLHIRPVEEAE